MKHLIEYKLWAGQIPYFVADPLGGIFNGNKCYGVSQDTDDSFLPDSVKKLSLNELWECVEKTDMPPMAKADKLKFYNEWLARNGLPEFTGPASESTTPPQALNLTHKNFTLC